MMNNSNISRSHIPAKIITFAIIRDLAWAGSTDLIHQYLTIKIKFDSHYMRFKEKDYFCTTKNINTYG